MDCKDAISATLKDMRTDEKAKELYDRAVSLCTDNNINIPDTTHRRGKKTKRMEDYLVESACGSREEASGLDNFRTKLYFPCLDRMISELDNRFSSVSEEIVKGIQACNPLSGNFLNVNDIEALATHYKVKVLAEEVLVAKNYIARTHGDNKLDMSGVYRILDPVMFPTVTKVLQIALTIPVSSCSCERSFSTLRRLHTWLRSTMCQDRLDHLAMLSINKTVMDTQNRCAFEGAVIDRFAKMHNRRHALILPEAKKCLQLRLHSVYCLMLKR